MKEANTGSKNANGKIGLATFINLVVSSIIAYTEGTMILEVINSFKFLF
jgi:hypothetical protein